MGHSSVGFTIDSRREEPIHRQIFDQIVARIETRAFPPGFKLPPTRVLARELKAHRNTVTRAYADLEAAGFVCGSVGRGTFVEEARSNHKNKTPSTVASSSPSSSSSAVSSSSSSNQAPHQAQARWASGSGARHEGALASAEMPWASIIARGARPDILARAEQWARRVDGRDVINLARMQPSDDLLPVDLMRRCVTRVMAEQGAKAMSYAPPEGVPRLREQIARELVSRGVPATPDDVLITSGSQQGLDLIARTLVNPGDSVLVESTTYSGAIDLFRLAGARLVPMACDDQGPIPELLERQSRALVKAIYLMPTGHNPTGRTMSTDRRHAIVNWARANGLPIIEDDFVAGLSLDDGDQEDPPYLRALDGEVIHISTFSKRLIPSLRIGYVVTPAALRGSLRSMKRVVDLASSGILQHSLAEFIERGYLRAHTTRVTRTYRARRDALIGALRKNMPSEITWSVPSHGIVLWLDLPQGVDVNELYEEALKQGVLVSPSPMWSVDQSGRTTPGIRLAFCSEGEERIAEGAKRLGKAMKTVLARTPPRKPTAVMNADSKVLEAV